MKVLGAMIAEKCSSKLWNPVKASQGGMAFSHLFFADDLVLFARADRKNCVAVREVLDSFCDLSGQRSVRRSLGFSFLPMFQLIVGLTCVIFWDFGQLRCLVSTLDS